jgi:FdhD protein
LAKDSEILYYVEDVGRHNAVDAIAGMMWLDEVDGRDKIFYTTGRLTSEMVIKAAQMGVPFLISRSGLTKMGWEIAQRVGMTMIGRAQGKHFLLFTGTERFRHSSPISEVIAA